MDHTVLKFLSGAILILALCARPALLNAQSAPPSLPPIELGAPAAPANTVSCFDYYKFGSVQAKLSTQVSGAVSGTNITFAGVLENKNPYPIVDGALYIKILKTRGENDGNGPDVIDQLLVKSGIAIPPNGSTPISFAWHVPSRARSGDYRLATFFTTSRKFNLLGLPFTDDVVGNTVPFKIIGEEISGIMFTKTGVAVNGKTYRFAAFPPRVPASEPVTIQAEVQNTTSQSQKATIAWTISQWDGQLRENVVQEEKTTIEVPAGESMPVSIKIHDAKYPVYLATGILTWEDTKSVIGVRFVREGIDRTRINFLGVMDFPFRAGTETTLFSCLHNTGQNASVPNGRMELTLSDEKGVPIHSYTYAGDVTGAMMGVAEKFTPERSYDYFTLDARLYSGNIFIDEAHLVYDCNQIDPRTCLSPQEKRQSLFSRRLLPILLAIAVIGCVLLSMPFLLARKRKAMQDSETKTTISNHQ